MNWVLIAAGAFMVIASLVHGAVGDRALRKMGSDELPPDRFGGGKAATKAVLRTSWHFGTIAFGVVGAWLVVSGLQPSSVFAAGVTYLSGTLLSCFAVVGVVVSIYRRGFVGFLKRPHPGPLALAVASLLVWWGSTSL